MKAFPICTNKGIFNDGMDLRDYFAAKAMQGLLSDPNCDAPPERMANVAYQVADAMMKAREE
jgi:hypothetical protein